MADLSSSSLTDTSTKDFKKDLLTKIKQLDGLNDSERAELVKLLNDTKKYGLIWEEKPESAEELLRTKLPVLREVVERRILSESEFSEFENEQNRNIVPQQGSLFSEEKEQIITEPLLPNRPPNHILIEGDNLHALTALTFTHEGRIDVIYIDPPYNTGNKDFKYNDSFVDKEDSYRHSKWLSFMHKRLKIAKRLLSDKGVIFISIDDNEQAQLKMLCDEVFVEINYIGMINWQRAYSPKNQSKKISKDVEYILSYAKSYDATDFALLPRTEKMNNRYKNIDNDPRGPWKSGDLVANEERKNGHYIIRGPKGDEFDAPPGKHWSFAEDKMLNLLQDNRLHFGKDGRAIPSLKQFLTEVQQGRKVSTLFLHDEVGHTDEAKKELKQFFEQSDELFSTPKPTRLIKQLLRLSIVDSPIILDFFAGSGTTLQAVIEMNADGKNRQCILVTNNENNICEEVTYERNRRVIQGYTNAKGEWVKGLKNNNLRYYQVDFVDSAKTEINRRKLTVLSTNLLQIKEDCYLDITDAEGFDRSKCSIHSNERGKYMVVIYHSRTQIETTELLSNWIASRIDLSEKIKIYAFGHETEIIVDDFYAVVDKIDAVPLPDAIYNAYRATFRTLKLDKKPLVTNFETLQTVSKPEEN